jgi:hypothetical protein
LTHPFQWLLYLKRLLPLPGGDGESEILKKKYKSKMNLGFIPSREGRI